MYTWPILKQLVLLLHWVLVTINDGSGFAGAGPELDAGASPSSA